MSEETKTIDPSELEVVTVPAQLVVQIGKRKRKFDDTEEGRKKMAEAIEKFNNGGRKPASGIMAVRKANKARMEHMKGSLTGYVVSKELAERDSKKCAGLVNTLFDLCEAHEGLYVFLTGDEDAPEKAELPGEGEGQGEGRNVEQNESSEAEGDDLAADPLAGLTS